MPRNRVEPLKLPNILFPLNSKRTCAKITLFAKAKMVPVTRERILNCALQLSVLRKGEHPEAFPPTLYITTLPFWFARNSICEV